MPNFSVVLIVRNESKTLPRLLKSLEEFKARGGQVCCLDTGSTDDTASIARAWGCKVEEVGDRFVVKVDEEKARVINEKFCANNELPILHAGDRQFDYSSARNYAATLASNDIIAMPDADEVYTKLDIDAIEKAIAEGVQQFEYQFVFSHDEQGRPLIQFLHCKFYDRRVLRWSGVVHEVLQGVATRRYFDKDIIFLEHYQNPDTNRSHYLRGLAIDCYEHPDNDRNKIGRAHV